MHMKRLSKKIHKMIDNYPVIVYKDTAKGYWVSCPVFQGCYSQGETIDEALVNIREAITVCKDDSFEKILTKGNAISLHFVQV